MTQQNLATEAKDTLYFDGSCPLCSKEIMLLKKLTKDSVNFANIHSIDYPNNKTPTKDNLLKRLHLQKRCGKWLIGLDATIAVWSHTNYGFLFKILKWPIICPIANRIYKHWANKRFDKQYQCSTNHSQAIPKNK